ncbi:MAG: hypothetical protein L3J95_02565 [Thermoplasmata archaeon]|nr:hypothetical protein [Thermoplasmata archaeon]MCI4359290.1 hypothetical protein [Thermoplasmata archaeon]
MRTGWVIGGVIVLILGFVLWYVPMSLAVGSSDVPATAGLAVNANPPLALLSPNLPYSATYSSDSGLPVNVTVYNCGTDSTCTHFNPSSDRVASGKGSTGTLTWSGVKGNYYLVVPTGLTGKTTISVTVGEPLAGGLAGIALVVIGLLLLLVGAASKQAVRPPPQPMPPAEPAQGKG